LRANVTLFSYFNALDDAEDHGNIPAFKVGSWICLGKRTLSTRRIIERYGDTVCLQSWTLVLPEGENFSRSGLLCVCRFQENVISIFPQPVAKLGNRFPFSLHSLFIFLSPCYLTLPCDFVPTRYLSFYLRSAFSSKHI
jgi:hypothetical protein